MLGESVPDEIYDLGRRAVRTSFDVPLYTCDVDGLGNLRLLEGIVRISREPLLPASSSELFGKVVETPQREHRPVLPAHPYGIANKFTYWTTVNYRESHGLFACNGILFNRESPRRGETFVSRKNNAVANILAGRQTALFLGNLDAQRDWGYKGVCGVHVADAPAAVPDDFVIAAGETHTVRDSLTGLSATCIWTGRSTSFSTPSTSAPPRWTSCSGTPPRPRAARLGAPSRFRELVRMMVDADIKETK